MYCGREILILLVTGTCSCTSGRTSRSFLICHFKGLSPCNRCHSHSSASRRRVGTIYESVSYTEISVMGNDDKEPQRSPSDYSVENFSLGDPFKHFEKFFHEIAMQNVARTLLCGAVAGCIAKTAIAPAERVKMSFQISSDKFTLGAALNRGIKMFKDQGFFSLWRGNSTTIIRVAPFAAINYAAHDYAEAEFKAYTGSKILPYSLKFLAGSIGGAVATFFTYPLDVLRVRMALRATPSWSAAMKQGGLYQGLTPTILGIIPYNGTAWCVKQTMQEAFPGYFHRKPTVYEALFINASAGLAGQFVTYPLDVVRRRMQMAEKLPDGTLRNLRSTLVYLVKTEGIRGLGKGFSLNIIKGPITLSISLTTYDLLMSWIRKMDNKL